MTAFPIARPPRVAAARKLGEEAANAAEFKAGEAVPDFSARALEFIRAFVAAQPGPVAGEDITLAARKAGIRPSDDRAFGSVYAKAIQLKYIKQVGWCARTRGHGCGGGRLYGRGESA